MRTRLFLSFFVVVLVTVVVVVLGARQGAATQVRAFMAPGGMIDTEELVADLEGYYAAHGSWEGAESLLVRGARGQGWQGGRGQRGAQGGQGGRGMGGHGMGVQGMMDQRLRLADAAGNVLVDTSDQQPSGQLNPEERQNAIPLEVDGRVAGYLLAEGGVTFDPGQEQQLITRLGQAALVAGGVAVGLSLLLSLLLSYSLLRPVRALTQAAARLGRGDLSQRVPVRGNDEIAALARAFNGMANSLQSAEAGRRSIMADIAHELRNPLAVQRANLEALQDGIYPLTPENLAMVLAQNLQLTRLVEDLRTLALAEAGQLPLEKSPADFPALVRGVLDDFTAQASAREITLQLDADGDSRQAVVYCPPVELDAGRVRQILGNLLSNALRHTPDGGLVHLQIRCDRGSVYLAVHDSGPGIPAESLPHIFERFYRADRSRTRSQGGTGLGLSIARQLAEAHGGELTAANHPQGGALFTLRLPLQGGAPWQKTEPRSAKAPPVRKTAG